MKSFQSIGILFSFFVVSILSAQQSVTYNGKTFKKAEIALVQLGNSGERFSFVVSENDMTSNGAWAKEVRCLQDLGEKVDRTKAPKGLSLHLSLDFKNGFSFPIKPTDSIVMSLSNIKNQLTERKFTENEISKIDLEKAEQEKEDFATKKATSDAELKRIMKLMAEGKISSDDAMKQMDALINPLIEEVESSYAYTISPKSYEDYSSYDIAFTDTIENIEAIIFEGTLHIVEFNKNKLVAYIKGKHIVECTDVSRKNASSGECKQVTSTLDPRMKVLKEEAVYLSINSTFNEFRDNRN